MYGFDWDVFLFKKERMLDGFIHMVTIWTSSGKYIIMLAGIKVF